jgi:energy-coupling factor transporter ATP-binding protein EcfA2
VDFCKIRVKDAKGIPQAYPDWIVDHFEDLMVRGGSFYAVWDEQVGMWSTNEYDVRRLVDEGLTKFVEAEEAKGRPTEPLYARNFNSGTWERFNKYVRNLPANGNYHPLDEKLTFENTEVKKKDYVSKRVPYALAPGRTDAWDELVGVLFAPEERDKIEWSIGAIVAGDSRWLQKFLVFYGPPGTGKSTVINIIEKLFQGYISTFEAKSLTSNSGTFAMESFEDNPLVALQHDGDLSRIEDNTRLNSIVGHDSMNINVKYKSAFTIRPNAFVIIGTNKPVKISDAKAGNTRRLIDAHPTGAKIEPNRYHVLVNNIEFELGAIAHACLQRYREMGRYYYENYIPTKMMMLTDSFYNFVEAHFDLFKNRDGTQLKYAWDLYKQYCEEGNIIKRLQYHEVRDELGSYFEELKERHIMDGKEYRSVYVGFKGLPEQGPTPFVPDTSYVIELGDYDSAFDTLYPDAPAQEANKAGKPGKKWERVTTTLKDIDTTNLHYVKIPEQHIVIDFDLVDEDGEKDLQKNIEYASRLPPTYTELSQSGRALHLHYMYVGDVSELHSVYDVGIEIKTLLGDSALRRKLTKCNNLDIASISGGLPKKVKTMIESKSIQSERALRELIERNLRKEIHPGTKPSIDFIHHILESAYNEGLGYNVEDMRPTILAFAAKSTNQALACVNLVQTMKFVGKNMEEVHPDEKPIIFFDVEVYPNLFIVCWKVQGKDQVMRMINPIAEEVGLLFRHKLVGFNNRRYDNHILYARYMGYSLEELYELSQRIINNLSSNPTGMFGEAYNISYADIFDFSSKKQGLKKFQIELGIHHMELDLPWDQPVPEGQWQKVEDYCANDVIATEAVFESRKQDFVARQILAELSGLSVNHTTQQHTAKILFGDDKNPQGKFVYTDLSEQFPGYIYGPVKDPQTGHEKWVSEYGEEDPGEGGYVYSEPGVYENVAVLDVASMHPTSIVQLNLFGPYTTKFSALKDARMAIKHKDYDKARGLLDGKLGKFLEHAEDDEAGAEALAYALKIVINIVYGLTSARFENPFRDVRNVDNIVAKRGALFMIDLKHAVQDRNFLVVHIKTDSIKIPNATKEIIDFIIDFGRKYGYEFEHEITYDKFALINDAVYVARSGGKWTAVGAQFQHPYVFKTLFSHEDLEFDDLCEVKNVAKGTMYLGGFGDPLDVSEMRHVGRTGSFMPVRYDGRSLWRVADGKAYHVAGTKGYAWVEREIAKYRESIGELETDMEYFEKLNTDAIRQIERFIPFEELVS